MSELSKTQRIQLQQQRDIEDEAIGRLHGARDFMQRVDAFIEVSNARWDDLKTNGFNRCEGHRVEIENLKTNAERQWSALNKLLRGGGGDWLKVGNWRAAGIPAIILALILGLAAYQRWETKAIAADVNSVKESQEVYVRKQALAIARTILDELKLEGNKP
jgi:hypothetical protein